MTSFPRFHWFWWIVAAAVVIFVLNATGILHIHFQMGTS